MAACKHQFIRVSELDKWPTPTNPGSRSIPGVIVVCPLCGEVRHCYADGEIRIKATPTT